MVWGGDGGREAPGGAAVALEGEFGLNRGVGVRRGGAVPEEAEDGVGIICIGCSFGMSLVLKVREENRGIAGGSGAQA
ncbi:hypothetical protein MLD38_032034 [Melastoma candidum]|uniref:Uncharacterized protein n=1 Tax=Melastoma candidum TaxID=119954 RepID=A0ACB9MR40_9MYRT|nr:hypothetical protein MLD38_032034 [Melastoma candidum]